MEENAEELDYSANKAVSQKDGIELALRKALDQPLSRRKMLVIGTVTAGSAAGGALAAGSHFGLTKNVLSSLVSLFTTKGVAEAGYNVTYAAGSAISDVNRLSLRALWDAVVPGDWNGNIEDGGEPGADQTYVEAWLEQVAAGPTNPISWLTADFLNFWGADINAWAQVTTFWSQEYYQMPLGTSIVFPSTRQGKIILMMNLLIPGVETIFDLQYLGAIMLSKLAFFGDFYFEANDPTVSVGRAYCGAHLPPGTTPYAVDSYDKNLGISDKTLIKVNGLVNFP